MINEWLMVGVGILLTIGTGLFVASEFALVNLDRHELETRQEQGEKNLGPVISALKITSTHLSSAQLGITITTLLTGYTFEPALAQILRSPLLAIGIPEGAVRTVGGVVAMILATLFSMLVGELIPKNLALALPRQTGKWVSYFQIAFTAVFKPIILLLNNTANAIIRSMGIEPKEELSGARSARELTYLIRHSATAGLLEPHDAVLLNRTLRFSEYDASDAMTPRVRMQTVPVTASANEVIAAARASGLSRFPVIDESPDDVVGMVHVKQAFAVALKQRETTGVRQLMTSPLRIPETVAADDLLGQLRNARNQIAIVTDEHGGTAGLITLEDLVEEIVGELSDEHDRLRAGLTRRAKSVTFDASWRPDELLDRARIHVPEDEEYDTVGGYVVHELERIPELGDEVRIASGILRVEHMDNARIVRLRYIPDNPESDPSLMNIEEQAHHIVREGFNNE